MTWPQGRARWLSLGAAAVAVLAIAWIVVALRRPAPAPAPDSQRIVARGWLEPQGRVHLVSGPAEGGVVADLRVDEGAHVKEGQVLAVLDRHANDEAAVASAERDLDLARLQSRQVSAGAKPADVAAQQALVGAREAELERARQQHDRSERLQGIGYISGDALEESTLALQRAQRGLAQARASLGALTQTRPIDTQVADAAVAQAQARLQVAQAAADRSVIRAPIDGVVLALHTRKGAALGPQGLLSVGDIDHMTALAEFDEATAERVRPGQPVSVVLRGGSHAYPGRVFRILNVVNRDDRTSSDVLTGRDARVVEAEIRFDPGQAPPPLVGAEATVTVTAPAERPAA